MDDFNSKIKKIIVPKIENIKNPIILEFGVQKGRSTIEFIKYCEKNNGHLYSFDIDDCSKVSNSNVWHFYQTRDDNFDFIKSKIPKKIDVLFIDTIHEASHVKKILYNYYDHVKEGGYIFIDDISHLPYLKNFQRDNFYCEINNHETFKILLEIYSKNTENIDLSFSFISSGLAIIKKKTELNLKEYKKLYLREFSIKNFVRKLWQSLKRN